MSEHTITLGQLNAPMLGVTLLFADGAVSGALQHVEHGHDLDDGIIGASTTVTIATGQARVRLTYPAHTPVTVLVARDDEDPRTA